MGEIKAPATEFQAPRKRDPSIESSVLLVMAVTVLLVITIAIVVIMVEFCGGWWLRPLSRDLFSARVLIFGDEQD